MKIGLYFGSFNPIHHGHLIIAEHILNFTDIQRIWFVVSPQNPFKQNQTLLNEYHRLHLVKLAIEGDSKMKAENIEFKLPKPSYTSVTLQYLEEKYPSYEFTIIMGSDSFQNLDKWHNADILMKKNKFVVYQRPGFEIRNDLPAKFTALEAPLLQISSTFIRELIKKGKSIKYLVPDIVRTEIENAGFYK